MTTCVYDTIKKTLTISSSQAECRADDIFELTKKSHSDAFKNDLGNTIVFQGTITSIVGQNSALKQLTNVTNIKLPSTLLTLGPNVFKGMTSLQTINLGDTQITDIGENCFEGCIKLNSCFGKFNNKEDEEILPSTLKRIGDECFKGCVKLGLVDPNDANIRKTLHIPKSITALGMAGFKGTRYKKIVFEDFDHTFLTRFDNNTFTSGNRASDTTIKIVFYEDGPEFVSNMFIYNEDNGEKKKDTWFADNLTQTLENGNSIVNIAENDVYYNTVKQISNGTPDHLYLTDKEFKFMLKYNFILSDNETPQASVIINQINKKSEELQKYTDTKLINVQQDQRNFKTIVITGFAVITTAVLCNAIVLYKRK